jgi:hypothetical protein
MIFWQRVFPPCACGCWLKRYIRVERLLPDGVGFILHMSLN